MGLIPAWAGRGQDGGRDLYFTETLKGKLHKESTKWLVQCKDKSKSNKSVTESECGAILDKVRQHKCGGYLLVTTTTAGSALKEKLDSLDVKRKGEINTLVWDKYTLDAILRRAEHIDIFKSYFPESWKKENSISTEDAIRALESKLSNDKFEDLKKSLGMPVTSGALPQGYEISPKNMETASVIDHITKFLIKGEMAKATVAAESLEEDVLAKLFLKIMVHHPGTAAKFQRNIIRQSKLDNLKLNAFQILLDNEEISAEESVELSSFLASSELETLFGNEIIEFIQTEILSNGPDYAFWNDIDQLSSHTIIEYVHITDLAFSHQNRKQINYNGSLEFEVQLEFDRELIGNTLTFPGNFNGYFDPNGNYLTNVTINTSSFYE